MLREAMARYGRDNLGFFWLIGEPLILSCGVLIIWTAIGGHGHAEVGMVPLMLSGYATLTLQRHIINRATHKLRNSTALLYHRKIHLLDGLISTTLLESISVLGAFLVAYAGLYLFDLVPAIRDPIALFGSWLLWVWYLFASALIIASLTELVEWVEHLIPPLMYFGIPISGTFYISDWIPYDFRKILLLNPQVHVNELFRSAFFPPEVHLYGDPWYVFWWSAIMMAIGLFMVDYAKLAIRYD
ncbi:ABC transporter permease [Methyloraptor flagellatus]|uniref:Sugar ABC transporter permease n=1 Tax=Methyloraptor flagellatus TaxID=3162530 RepID=A0AAU7XAF1_9HYPH